MSNEQIAPPNWGKVIHAAIGRNAAKYLQNALDISAGQARRIAWSGHVPQHLEPRFLDAMAALLARRRLELASCDEVIRDAEHRRALRAMATTKTSKTNRGIAENHQS